MQRRIFASGLKPFEIFEPVLDCHVCFPNRFVLPVSGGVQPPSFPNLKTISGDGLEWLALVLCQGASDQHRTLCLGDAVLQQPEVEHVLW